MEDQKPFRGLQGKTPEALFGKLRTPCYILDERILRENGKALKDLMDRTGCRVLLAQKAFSNYDLYPVLAPYLAGTEASGLYEARLGREKMPQGEVHVFSGAYRDDEMDEVLQYADHVVFNSPSQLRRFGLKAKKRERVLVFGSTLNARPRKAMTSMTPARREAGLERRGARGIKV